MAGSEPNHFYQRQAPTDPAIGDTWDNGIQVRIFMKQRGWVNLGGPAVEADV